MFSQKNTPSKACALRLIGYILLYLIFFVGIFIGTFKTGGRFALFVLKPHLFHDQSFIEKSSLEPFRGGSFSFLSQGSQSFVFESEDQRVVLKLFRFNRYTPKTFFKLESFLPHPIRNRLDHYNAERTKKERDLLLSLELACGIPELTGIIAYHLEEPLKTPVLITLFDSLGRRYTLDLSKTVCVIQKKGVPTDHYLENKSLEEKRDAFASLKQIYHSLDLLEIEDLDPVIGKNCGFEGSTPFFLDLGGFRKRGSDSYDVERILSRFEAQIGL